jgi:hypothetical protein
MPLHLHKEPEYDFGHTMKDGMDPEQCAGATLPYKAVSRIVNVLEDLHAQMQKPEGERFLQYQVENYEVIDTFIRDYMANLALSLELRAQSERNPD